ncbi:MAG: hypothetical protein IPO81_17800 [Kouleothrix sp.]|nr:hypothetical protein [Kouleothrix sp.]
MGAIDDRLERGVAIFRRAGDDAALLGAALLAFHGALESYLDGELDGQANLGPQERELLGRGRLGWPARAQLAGRSGLLDQRQCELALAATRERLAIGRGDVCSWAAPEVQTYGRLVASVCGRRELHGRIDQRSERARVTVARPAMAAAATPESRRRSLIRFGAATLFLAALCAIVWTLYTQLDGPRLLRSVGVLPAPTALAATAAPAATPTPPPRLGKVVRLNGGPGWLHVTPSFDSPTRAIRLAEGMQVTLLDQSQVDAGGVSWQLVAAGGYEGWSPTNNIEPCCQTTP